jgi:hypothetical protein
VDVLPVDDFMRYLSKRLDLNHLSALEWSDLDSFQIMEVVAILDECGVIIEEEAYSQISTMHELYEAYIAATVTAEVGRLG